MRINSLIIKSMFKRSSKIVLIHMLNATRLYMYGTQTHFVFNMDGKPLIHPIDSIIPLIFQR